MATGGRSESQPIILGTCEQVLTVGSDLRPNGWESSGIIPARPFDQPVSRAQIILGYGAAVT